MRRSLVLLPFLIALAVLATTLPVTARSNISIGVSRPEGFGPDPVAVMAAVDAHIAQVGTKPRLWSLRSTWGDRQGSWQCKEGKGSCAFPTEAVLALQARGITPVIWWLPMEPGKGYSKRFGRYKRILAGAHDQYIRDWARAAKAAGRKTGRPVVIRYAQEPEGHWFPWSIKRQDNTATNFKRAWAYVWKGFRGVGARNHVRWLWSTIHPKKSFYPGDKYVDYIGATVLNDGAKRWRPAKAWIDKRVKALLSVTRTKRIIFPEVATSHIGGNKGTWIKEAYLRAYWKHPKVKGMVYLDTDEPAISLGHPDWRLKTGDRRAGLNAYKKIAKKSKFKGRIS